jgi:hypothetical protein
MSSDPKLIKGARKGGGSTPQEGAKLTKTNNTLLRSAPIPDGFDEGKVKHDEDSTIEGNGTEMDPATVKRRGTDPQAEQKENQRQYTGQLLGLPNWARAANRRPAVSPKDSRINRDGNPKERATPGKRVRSKQRSQRIHGPGVIRSV